MTRVGLLLFSGILRVLLTFASRKEYEIRNQSKANSKESRLPSGWEFKKVLSVKSGLTHQYYEHKGPTENAPVLLLLHGLVIDGRNFVNLTTLTNQFRLIAYNFPDTSPSYRGKMDDFDEIITDFLNQICIRKFCLLGVSFGGGVALRYAALHKDKVSALILVSSFIMNATPVDKLRTRELSRILLKYPDYKLFWFLNRMLSISFRDKTAHMSKLREAARYKDMKWYRQVVGSLSTTDGPKDASMVNCPVLGLQGTSDTTVKVKSAKTIPLHIKHSKFELIEGGTHAMILVHGKQIAEKIRAFCAPESTL